MRMDQEPDALDQAIDELRQHGVPDDRIDYYAKRLALWADAGSDGNRWQASHLRAAARGYARLDQQRREGQW